jgi:uncharacterized protein (DUF58 family)
MKSSPHAIQNRPATLVPQARFLFWFAVIVLPFSVLGAVYAEAQIFAAVLIVGLLLLATLDALYARRRLEGLGIELPSVLRFSLDRPGAIEIQLQNPAQQPVTLRLGLSLPAALQSPQPDLRVVLPAGAESSRLEWPCRPVRRGRFLIERAHLEAPSATGFWAIRRTLPVATEVRVYPNLHRERQNLAALFLHRGGAGRHAQRQVGKGREFEKLREYVSGDSYDEIHWKATAKRGHPVTKVFQIERTQEVYIILDASRLSARRLAQPGSPAAARPASGPNPASEAAEETEQLERFITSALVLAQAAERQGDLFGLVTFTDQVGVFLRARNGQHHYAACRDALYTLSAQNVSPDFDEIVSFLRTRLRRRALLVFLTSLDDPMLAESFTRNMALLARQHLVLVSSLQATGVAPLFSTADNVTHIDDLYRHLGGHLQWHRLRELQKTLQHRGVRFSLVDDERMAVDLVAQYLSVKQRQLL